MTQEDLQMLDEILKTKNTDYSSVKTVAKAVTSIMLMQTAKSSLTEMKL